MTALALAALAAGLVLYVTGRAVAEPVLAAVGMACAVAAVPVVTATRHRADRQATDEQLAAADQGGYWRAIDHVTRGLLDDQPPAPEGTPAHNRGATIHHLPAHHHTPPEREAQ